LNTPAHLVVNLAVLGGGKGRPHTRSIAFGALLADLPMFGFFAWEHFGVGLSQSQIWGERYFAPDWQLVFDLFNSIPIALAIAAIGYATRRRALVLGSLSLVLHALLDLPVHREDGHRHFLPITNWRFMSPVSYWDPSHHGAWGAGIEAVLLLLATAILWRRHPGRGPRSALALLALLSVTTWIVFYGLGQLPSP
jgi:hypothetical protein